MSVRWQLKCVYCHAQEKHELKFARNNNDLTVDRTFIYCPSSVCAQQNYSK